MDVRSLKQSITICLDTDIVAWFMAGAGDRGLSDRHPTARSAKYVEQHRHDTA